MFQCVLIHGNLCSISRFKWLVRIIHCIIWSILIQASAHAAELWPMVYFAVWFVEFSLVIMLPILKEQLILYQNLCCLVNGVPLCNCYFVLEKETVANSAWAQSRIAIYMVCAFFVLWTMWCTWVQSEQQQQIWHVPICIVCNSNIALSWTL